MNEKGFAISVILYSIVFLVVTIMFMLLGIVKTRYTVSDELRKNIILSLDNIDKDEISSDSIFTCRIDATSDDYDVNLILRIIVDDNKALQYSFDNIDFVESNEIVANHSGIYTGYFIDINGNKGMCSVELSSKMMYRFQDCSNENKIFGNWYKNGQTTYSNTCERYSISDAERNYKTWYRTCDTPGNSQGYEQNGILYYYAVNNYNRKILGCNWDQENSNWSNWSFDAYTSKNDRRVETKDSYKVR